MICIHEECNVYQTPYLQMHLSLMWTLSIKKPKTRLELPSNICLKNEISLIDAQTAGHTTYALQKITALTSVEHR